VAQELHLQLTAQHMFFLVAVVDLNMARQVVAEQVA
jgi:hypothetical protein